MLPARIRRSLVTVLVTTSLLVAAAFAAPVAAKNPPGNNGTVKIDRVVFDDHPNNQPHVGCQFQVDFYGFDADPNPASPTYFADVVFELHSPTSDGGMTVSGDVHPFIGEDDNSGGASEGQPGLDASETYTLSFTGAAHPKQGHHVKLTVHAPGSQGADTKHKVFWVEGCTHTSNPPNNPPGGGTDPQTTPRGGTAAGTSGVVLLPDTSVGGSSTPLTILAGVALLGGSTTLVAVAVRRNRTDRD